LEWNVKDKDTTNREMDAGCALIDAGYRAREFNAPPEITGGVFFAGRFLNKSAPMVFPSFSLLLRFPD
jgi:hypothetical protein